MQMPSDVRFLSSLPVLAATLSLFMLPGAAPAAAGQARIFNIADYGSIPGGGTLDTAAIQKALDACGQAGGGIVKVPSGTYLIGTLYLRDNVTLSLEAGATLLGSPRIEDYSPHHLIVGKGVKNITLLGPGTIDGQGFLFWSHADARAEARQETRTYGWVPQHSWKHNAQNPGDLVVLEHCSGVTISGLALRNSTSWTLHLLACDHVRVDGASIRNRLNGPNTDGIDVQGCQGVQISNCDICTGDDAIVLKNRNAQITYPHACKDVTVANCKLTSPTNGFKIGTESYGDFENIVFRDSVIQAADPNDPLCADSTPAIPPGHYGNPLGPEAGIAVESVDGAHIRGVLVTNIVMHGARSPIFIRLGSRGIDPNNKQVKAPTGTISDVTLSNIVADGASAPSTITGVPGHPVQNITLSNLQVTNIGNGTTTATALGLPEKETSYPGALMWGPMPAHSLFMRHAEGIKLSGLRFTNSRPDTRLAVIADDVAGLALEGLTLDPVAASDPLILLNDVRKSTISGTIPRNTNIWVQVSGSNSADISLAPTGTGRASHVFALSEGAPANAVILP